MFSNNAASNQDSTQAIAGALTNRQLPYQDIAVLAKTLLDNKDITDVKQTLGTVLSLIKEKGSRTNLDSLFYDAVIKYKHLLSPEEIADLAESIILRANSDKYKYHPDLKLLIDLIDPNTVKHLLLLIKEMPKLQGLIQCRIPDVFAKIFSLLTNSNNYYSDYPNSAIRNSMIKIIMAEYRETSPEFCLDLFAKLIPHMSVSEKEAAFSFVLNAFKLNDRFCMFYPFIEFIKSFSDLSDQKKENAILAILQKVEKYHPDCRMNVYNSINNLVTWMPGSILDTVVNKCMEKLDKRSFLPDQEKQFKIDLIATVELARVAQFPQNLITTTLGYAKEESDLFATRIRW